MLGTNGEDNSAANLINNQLQAREALDNMTVMLDVPTANLDADLYIIHDNPSGDDMTSALASQAKAFNLNAKDAKDLPILNSASNTSSAASPFGHLDGTRFADGGGANGVGNFTGASNILANSIEHTTPSQNTHSQYISNVGSYTHESTNNNINTNTNTNNNTNQTLDGTPGRDGHDGKDGRDGHDGHDGHDHDHGGDCHEHCGPTLDPCPIIKDVTCLVGGIVGGVLCLVDHVVHDVTHVVTDVVHELPDIVTSAGGVVNTVLTDAGSILGGVTGTVNGVVGTVDGTLNTIIGGATGALNNAIGGVTGALPGVITTADGALNGVVGSVNSTVSGVVGSVGSTLNGVTGTLPGVISTVEGTVNNVLTSATGSAGGIINHIPDITGGLNNLVTGAGETVHEVTDHLLDGTEGHGGECGGESECLPVGGIVAGATAVVGTTLDSILDKTGQGLNVVKNILPGNAGLVVNANLDIKAGDLNVSHLPGVDCGPAMVPGLVDLSLGANVATQTCDTSTNLLNVDASTNVANGNILNLAAGTDLLHPDTSILNAQLGTDALNGQLPTDGSILNADVQVGNNIPALNTDLANVAANITTTSGGGLNVNAGGVLDHSLTSNIADVNLGVGSDTSHSSSALVNVDGNVLNPSTGNLADVSIGSGSSTIANLPLGTSTIGDALNHITSGGTEISVGIGSGSTVDVHIANDNLADVHLNVGTIDTSSVQNLGSSLLNGTNVSISLGSPDHSGTSLLGNLADVHVDSSGIYANVNPGSMVSSAVHDLTGGLTNGLGDAHGSPTTLTNIIPIVLPLDPGHHDHITPLLHGII